MGAESLQAACELAFVVARDDAESGYDVEPPASMRSFLYVSDLPRRAVSIAQQAIENDSDFRARVASLATEESVGRAGYLWLNRPTGWAQEFEQLTAEDDDEDYYDAADEHREGDEFPDANEFQDDEHSDHSADAEDSEDAELRDEVELQEDGDHREDTELSENDEFPETAVEASDDLSQPPPPQAWDATGYTGESAPEPDPQIEEVYNDLMSAPIELVSAQPPEPIEPDGFEPDDSFSPESPPISDAPMASVSLIGGNRDADPPPPSFEIASMGTAAVTDRAEYDVEEAGFSAFNEGDGSPVESPEMDFEADALENELSSLRGLVDRLAGEREMVVSSMPPEPPAAVTPVPNVGGRELESEIMALESDLESARHELTMAQGDLTSARHDREEAQRLQSQALKRQVDLEKELAAVREQRVEVENQASEAQVAAISLEDKLARIQSQFDEAERERNVVKSQLDTMTSERNQIREDRVAIKAERDDLSQRMREVEEKSGGVDIGELTSSNKAMTVELEATSRELARIVGQAESLEEQLSSTTSTADSLKTGNIELTSRLADTELALETTTTQRDALKLDSERLAADVGSLRAERDALQTQLTELQASLADVLAEQADSRQRNDADRQALNELRIERDVLMARMNDLEQADRDYETRIKALVAERDDLLASRDDLINERGQLRGEAAASASEKDQLLDKMASVEAKIGPLEVELQAERRQREELANRLLDLDDIAAQNAAELNSLSQERVSLSTSLEELQAERIVVGEIQAERDHLVIQLEESQRVHSEEQDRSQAGLADLTEKATALQSAKTELEGQQSETISELNALKTELDKANRELSRLAATEDQTSSALTEAHANVGILTSELETAREGKAEAEAHLALAEEARSDMSAQLESQKQFAAEKAEEAETALAEARIANEARSVAEGATRDAEAAVREADVKAGEAAAQIKKAEERVKKAEAAAAQAKSTATASALAAPSIIELESTESEDTQLEVGSTETVSVDLAALPSPFVTVDDEPSDEEETDDDSVTDEAAGVDDEDDDTTTGSAFEWPPASRDDDEDGVSPSTPPTILASPGALVEPDSVVIDDEEDDLDEVSELIAATVSSFSGNDTMDNPVVPMDDAEPEHGLSTADDEGKTSVLSGITSGPPSVFGAGPTKAQERIEDDVRGQPGRKRRQIEIPGDILDDEVAVAQFVVSSPDVVLLVDGDSVAKLGWPSYAVAQQRDALVTYLADLSASSGAAPDVVFDGRIGDDESLPASRAVRIRLSTSPTEPAAALDELVDAYPEQWPIALVTDDPDLASSASNRGAAVLNNGQLLDLFISE